MTDRNYQIRPGLEVCVIGMAGRFPGAKHLDEFLHNLKNGIESIWFLSEEELKDANIDEQLIDNPGYVKVKAGLEEAEYFDAFFFGYSSRDALVMDPQMRLFHEYSWAALENAGYDPSRYDGLIGVYVGGTPNPYWEALTMLSGINRISDTYSTARVVDTFDKTLLNDKDLMSMRVSYKLNLTGPSFTMFTSCSTSLVTIHVACQGLLAGECDMALAGGVSVMTPKRNGYLYQEGMIVSPDGHCRAFDAEAAGTVFGDGIGIVVLKRLEDALAAGDYIYAVVKGSAINNDGSRKVGFTAPSVQGQEEVICAALQMAEVEPEQIGYIEAHGAGTKIGDPIELAALQRAFVTDKKSFCAIGSVKTNVGHLNSAAGVCSFIKTVLSIKHRLIFPTLHFTTPNPNKQLENTPFYINTKLTRWPNQLTGNAALIAGVSAFGVGGTNGHMILGDAPPVTGHQSLPPLREKKLILLSANTVSALEAQTRNLGDYLKKNPTVNLADAAYTLQVGRRGFKYRRFTVCAAVDEAIEALLSPGIHRRVTGLCEVDNPPVVFMFPGLGAQYVNMGRELYDTEPKFREEMNRCFAILKPLIDYDLEHILYPRDSVTKPHLLPDMNQIEIAQLVIFIFEYALAKLLMKWGIYPRAMIGYSFGEYAAACLSGVLSLPDALKIIVSRGKLLKKVPPGAMLSVPLTAEQLKPLLNDHLSIAIDNGTSCIVAGSSEELNAFEKHIRKKRVVGMRLHNTRALHSNMMDPILEEFEKKVQEITFNKPQIPYISNLTGSWLIPEQAAHSGYWSKHLREPVRFAAGIKELAKEPGTLFVEIGPGHDLCALTVRHPDITKRQVINMVRPPHKDISDIAYLLNKLGYLWLYGTSPDWSHFYEEKRQRIPLPTYPFERKLYRFEEDALHTITGSWLQEPLSAKAADISNWFYIPSWKRVMLPLSSLPRVSPGGSGKTNPSYWLVFIDDYGMGDKLLKQMQSHGRDKIVVRKGKGFQQWGENGYAVNPGKSIDYERLFKALGERGKFPHRVLHLWGITGSSTGEINSRVVKEDLQLGFYSLIYQAKAIGSRDFNGEMQIIVVTNNMQPVDGEEELAPAKAAVLGPVKVISQEYRNIKCRSVDIVLPGQGSPKEQRLIRQLADEVSQDPPDMVVAYRGNYRWVQTFEPTRLPESEPGGIRLRKGGIYLVTGGLGRIGLVLAEYLVKQWSGKVVLVGRSQLPVGTEREKWLQVHGRDDPTSRKILKLEELEASAGEILVLTADVSSKQQMERAFRETEEVFGSVNGVIHAAGVTGMATSRSVKDLSDTECEEQFKPKIQGLMVLEELLQDKKPDFCLLTSSLSPILGGLGYTVYASANHFMDAFVHKHNREHPVQWISVNWETWENKEKKNQPLVLGAANTWFSMTPAQGVETFQRILSMQQVDEIVVSSGNLQARIDQWIKMESLAEDAYYEECKSLALEERPDLMTPYAAPFSRVEQTLVEIWESFFHVKGIGVRDDFFELGGDSLKAINVLGKVYREFNREIPIADFFANPCIQGIAEMIKKTKRSEYSRIKPVEKKEYYPLSPAQMSLFVLEYIEKVNRAFNEPRVMVLEGTLDRERFLHVFKQLIARHESFRTSFELKGGEPIQRLWQAVTFAIEYWESTGEEAKKIITDFIRPFELEKPPLLRVGLIHLHTLPPGHPRWDTSKSPPTPIAHQGETTSDWQILMVDMHHIAADGISMRLFLRDFMTMYNGDVLPTLKIDPKDYWEWQKGFLSSPQLKKQEQYWLKRFKSGVPVLNIPLDNFRSPVRSFEGSIIDTVLEEELTAKLYDLINKAEITMFIVLLAIYTILLSKYSRQEDIIVGAPIAGRSNPDLDHVIGMFVNMLALRNAPVGEKTFGEFLKEVKENALDAYENQDYPFEDLARTLVKKRDFSRNPIFDVVFSMQNVDFTEDRKEILKNIGPLTVTPYDMDYTVSRYDLQIIAFEINNTIHMGWEYSTALFKRSTIEKMVNHYKEIAWQVVDNPGIQLKDLRVSHELVAAGTGSLEDEKAGFAF